MNTPAEPFGLHLTLDAYGGSKTRLHDMKRVFKVLNELPGILDMKKLTTPYVVDAPPVTPKDQGGISGFVMIAESHVSIHTFPDKGFLTADIYSCKAFDTQKALDFFNEMTPALLNLTADQTTKRYLIMLQNTTERRGTGGALQHRGPPGGPLSHPQPAHRVLRGAHQQAAPLCVSWGRPAGGRLRD